MKSYPAWYEQQWPGNIMLEQLAERVWYTKFQSSLLNILGSEMRWPIPAMVMKFANRKKLKLSWLSYLKDYMYVEKDSLLVFRDGMGLVIFRAVR